MKLTIDNKEYPFAFPGDWTFEEAQTVRRLCDGMLPGHVLYGVVAEDPSAALAMAIVGHLREKPGEPVEHLLKMGIAKVVVDLTDPETESDGASPPAESGEPVEGRRGDT